MLFASTQTQKILLWALVGIVIFTIGFVKFSDRKIDEQIILDQVAEELEIILDTSNVDQLLKIITRRREPIKPEYVRSILIRIDHPNKINVLLDALKKASDTFLQIVILDIIADIDDKRAVDPLKTFYFSLPEDKNYIRYQVKSVVERLTGETFES